MSTFFDSHFRLIPDRRFHSPLNEGPDKVLTGYSVGRGCVRHFPEVYLKNQKQLKVRE